MSGYDIAILVLISLPLAVSFGKFIIKCILKFLDERYKNNPPCSQLGCRVIFIAASLAAFIAVVHIRGRFVAALFYSTPIILCL